MQLSGQYQINLLMAQQVQQVYELVYEL